MNKFTTNELVTASLLLAIGIILPMIFHILGVAGSIFLPMHIPIFIGGYLLPRRLALVLGFTTPLISSFLIGMPVLFPIAIIMVFELSAYALSVSFLSRKYIRYPIIPLICSMIIGRFIATIIVFIMTLFFTIPYSPLHYINGAIITGLPGIIIQLCILSPLIMSLKKIAKPSIL